MTPQEREYQIQPDWHDGETDDELEMAGWMHIPIQTYVRSYDGLEQPGDWDEYYVRPPLMLNGSSALLHLDEELAQIDRELYVVSGYGINARLTERQTRGLNSQFQRSISFVYNVVAFEHEFWND